MTVSLASAVEKWHAALLAETADFLTPDDVASAINDIVIETWIMPKDLPLLLRSLHVDATERMKKGNEAFSIIGLRHRAEKMLEELGVVAA